MWFADGSPAVAEEPYGRAERMGLIRFDCGGGWDYGETVRLTSSGRQALADATRPDVAVGLQRACREAGADD